MGLVTSQGYNLNPDLIGALGSGVALRGQIVQQRATEDQLGRENRTRELFGQALGGQAPSDQGLGDNKIDPDQENMALAELFTVNPQAALQLQEQLGLRDKRKLREAADFSFKIEGLSYEQQSEALQKRAQDLQSQGRNASDTLELLQANPDQRSQAIRVVQLLALSPEQRLRVSKGGKLSGETAKIKDFENLLRVAQDPNSTRLERDSARRELGDLARVSTSAQERIAQDKDLSSDIAKSQAQITGAKESAKLSAQLKFKPQIIKAVKLAQKEATERGEVLTDLARMEAAKPGLDQAVDQLRELSVIATSTIAGRLFDTASKELGFGTTKGDNARAKFIAIINNQVLPLLKPTFGAAFTVSEGDALKATMGDPDASPAQKMEQLDAFIAQKVRDIETKRAQLGILDSQKKQKGTIMIDANGNRALVFPDGTFEEL